VRSVLKILKNAVLTFTKCNLCLILTKSFLTLLKLSDKMFVEFVRMFVDLFAVSGRWKLRRLIQLMILGFSAEFGLSGRESVH
jgi:hypothetical protein